MDLNEDCLMEVFKHLNLLDLAMISKLGSWMYTCAAQSFEMHHKKTLNLLNAGFDLVAKDNFRRVLRCFGRSAKAIIIYMTPFKGLRDDMTILKWVARYSGANTESITLDGFTIDLKMCENNEVKSNLCRLISNLQTLNIYHGSLTNCGLWFDFCDRTIKTLNLQDVTMDNDTKYGFVRVYPNLTSLTMVNGSVSRSPHLMQPALKMFFTLNKTIRKLKLLKTKITNSLLALICGLPALSNLSIRVQKDDDVSQLARLPNLTRLKIIGDRRIIFGPVMDNFASRETIIDLELSDIFVNREFFQQLQKWHSLEILKLNRILVNGTKAPLRFVQLPKLKELHLAYSSLNPTEALMTEWITKTPTLRLLHVQATYKTASCLRAQPLFKLCRTRTDNGRLIVICANDFHSVIKVTKIKNTIIALPEFSDTNDENDLEYDFSDNEEEYSKIYQRIQNIGRRHNTVRLRDTSQPIARKFLELEVGRSFPRYFP